MHRPPSAPPFVMERAGSFHLEIDVDALARTLAHVPVPNTTRGRIVGPHDLHVLRELRRRHGIEGPGAIPADYFLWATGEAPHRAMTKLGGVPYLPAAVPWPERDGTTGDFYAQLNCVDSKSILPPLPGDVLLVFRFHDLACTSWDQELYEFVWVDLRDQDLIRPDEVRRSKADARGAWPAMHGYRVRTFDIPSLLDRLLADDTVDHRLPNAPATKLGGAATDVQSVREPAVSSDHRFLGQIAGVWPSWGTPYPVVDRAAPVAPQTSESEALTTGPGDGITCLYVDRSGNVRVHFSCA